MRKILIVTILSSLFLLSGCGSSGSSDPIVQPPIVVLPPEEPLPVEPPVVMPPEEPLPIEPPLYPSDPIYSVDLYELDNGYSIEGYTENGDIAIIEYCHGRYTYYRGVELFYGDFTTDGYTINMYDDDSGSYVIDTDTGVIEVGMNYYIFDINSYIDVEEIIPLTDCY